MTYPLDDLAPILADRPAQGVGYRQGIIKSWNSVTAENTVEVDGAVLTNLPILNTSEALLLQPGDVVGVLAVGESWAILGRLTVPGTAAAASSLSLIGRQIVIDRVPTQDSTTTGTSWVHLGGPKVTATIRQSGRALVFVSAQIGWVDLTASGAMGGSAALSVDGQPPQEPDRVSAYIQPVGTSSHVMIVQAANFVLVEGLTPGPHTFELVYRSYTHGKQADFDNRVLAVLGM